MKWNVLIHTKKLVGWKMTPPFLWLTHYLPHLSSIFIWAAPRLTTTKMHYLCFYWAISAHPLTVLYQMMLRRIQEYGSLGVIRALWTVLGWFLNSFLLFWRRRFASPKVTYLSFYLAVSAHLLTVLYQMMLRQVWWYGGLGAIWVLWMVLG